MAHAIKTIDELNMKQEEEEGCVVRLRGLPWSTTKEDIVQFFSDCHVADGINGVHLTSTKEGRPTGEGYLELETVEDVEQALKKHNEHMGTRYVEVFRSKRSEMEWVVKRSGVSESSPEEGCVRLRGLPFGCSKEEIAMFFSGLEIVPNGITLTTDFQGRSSGEAYVQFISKEVAEKALAKHKEKIGHRYIEIFRSSLSEVRAAAGVRGGQRGGTAPGPFGGNNRPSPYDRGDRFGGMNRYGTSRGRVKEEWGGRPDYARAAPVRGRFEGGPGHRIHMRGLPFRASEDDIAEFFRPFRPVSIRLVYDNTGRPSGEADVEFDNHDEALKAMAKDKQTMQHRYIELFLNSTPGTATSNFGAGYAGGYNTPGYAPRAGW